MINQKEINPQKILQNLRAMIQLMDSVILVDAAEGFFDDANEEFKKIQAQEALVQ